MAKRCRASLVRLARESFDRLVHDLNAALQNLAAPTRRSRAEQIHQPLLRSLGLWIFRPAPMVRLVLRAQAREDLSRLAGAELCRGEKIVSSAVARRTQLPEASANGIRHAARIGTLVRIRPEPAAEPLALRLAKRVVDQQFAARPSAQAGVQVEMRDRPAVGEPTLEMRRKNFARARRPIAPVEEPAPVIVLPACDRFFIDGFKAAGLSYSRLNSNFINRLLEFTHTNLPALRAEQSRIESHSGVRYPLMKLVDMYFWQLGYERDNATPHA